MYENKTKKVSVKPALPYIILFVIFVVCGICINQMFWLNAFIIVFAKMIPTVSLRIISLGGDMSFAMGCFMGVGAYMTSIATSKFGFPLWLGILVAALISAIIAVVTGIPFARLRTMYYCMTSMFFGVFLIYLFQGWDYTGGYQGMRGIPKLGFSMKGYYFFFLALAVVCIFLMWRFEHCRIGTTLKAISQSHEVAASMGVNERFYRMLAIGVAAFFCGVAGACYAHYTGQVVPTTYGMSLDLWIIMFMMIGGKKNFFGPIIGATILGLINESSRMLSTYAPYLACVALLIVAYLIPGGIVSIPSFIKEKRENRKNKGAGPSISEAAGKEA